MAQPDERRMTGDEVRLALFGPAGLSAQGPLTDLAPDVRAIADRALWDEIWTRPGLELRIKSLVTIVMLLATGRYPYAKAHIAGAKNIGWTREEITGVVVHGLMYLGLPAVHEGLALVAEVYGTEAADDGTDHNP